MSKVKSGGVAFNGTPSQLRSVTCLLDLPTTEGWKAELT